MFREALKAGWYDLHKARDTYRSITAAEGPHADVALRYAEVELRSTRMRTNADFDGYLTAAHQRFSSALFPAGLP